MSGFVIDASVVLAWHFVDEASDTVNALRARTDVEDIHVLPHWFAEIANGMLMGERRRRSTELQATRTAEALSLMSIHVDHALGHDAFHTLLPLARTHRLTVYDAAYLDLARRRGLPLATLDADLAAAARAAGVAVIDL